MGNIQCSQLAAMGATMTTTMTVEATGAYLRRETEAKGYGTAQVGSLFLHLTRHGCDWALELCDEVAIDNATAFAWQAAVGAPAVVAWRNEAHGRVARCEWQGTEDAAPDGAKAFYLGGAK